MAAMDEVSVASSSVTASADDTIDGPVLIAKLAVSNIRNKNLE